MNFYAGDRLLDLTVNPGAMAKNADITELPPVSETATSYQVENWQLRTERTGLMIETVTVLTDDLDKKTKTNVETVTFAIDGTSYEMELGSVNRRRLRETLQPYIEHGRKVTIQVNGQQRKRGQASKDESARIRAWAAMQPDITLNARGRVPRSVRERFRAATGGGYQALP